jgi:hypothetical protein
MSSPPSSPSSSSDSVYKDRYNTRIINESEESTVSTTRDNSSRNVNNEEFYVGRIIVNKQNSSSIIIPRPLALIMGLSKPCNALIYPEDDNSIRIKRLKVNQDGSLNF